MTRLGTLEDLPLQYREALTARNLAPLWPSMRAVLPYRQPSRATAPTFWAYRDIRPLLLEAGALTPIEKAERRVLVLANPGLGLENLQATPTIYVGMQLILPGETAPCHRHTPSAVRFVVEGEGAFTTVSGQKCPMHKGDLILTPAGEWHEHGHEGTGPVIWLDALDLPLVYRIEASFAIEGASQPVDVRRGRVADALPPRGAASVPDAWAATFALPDAALSVDRRPRRARRPRARDAARASPCSSRT